MKSDVSHVTFISSRWFGGQVRFLYIQSPAMRLYRIRQPPTPTPTADRISSGTNRNPHISFGVKLQNSVRRNPPSNKSQGYSFFMRNAFYITPSPELFIPYASIWRGGWPRRQTSLFRTRRARQMKHAWKMKSARGRKARSEDVLKNIQEKTTA